MRELINACVAFAAMAATQAETPFGQLVTAQPSAGSHEFAIGNGVTVGISHWNRLFYGSSATNGTSVFGLIPDANGHFQGVAFGNGRFVALAENSGALSSITSGDGTNWTVNPKPITAANSGKIAHGDAGFLVVGGSSAFISSNGQEWILSTLPAEARGQQLLAAEYINGHYWIGGQNGLLLRSTNGAAWDVMPTALTEPIVGIAHGNGAFIAVTSAGSSLRSDDGAEWRLASRSDFRFRDLASNGITFAANTDTNAYGNWNVDRTWPLFSVDGINWIQAHEDIYWSALHGQSWVGLSRLMHLVRTSPDGRAWQLAPASSGYGTVGASDRLVRIYSGWYEYSMDGTNWLRASPAPEASGYWHAGLFSTGGLIIDAGRRLDASLRAGFATSRDLTNWVVTPYPAKYFEGVRAATYDGERWVLVPHLSPGEQYPPYAAALVSTNGSFWESIGTTIHLLGLTFFKGQYYGVGGRSWSSGEAVFKSKDLTNWEIALAQPASYITSTTDQMVVLTGSRYGGANRQVFRSLDGTSWENRASLDITYINQFDTVNGLFVATGYVYRNHISLLPVYALSADAITWKGMGLAEYDAQGSTVAGLNGRFYVVGPEPLLSDPMKPIHSLAFQGTTNLPFVAHEAQLILRRSGAVHLPLSIFLDTSGSAQQNLHYELSTNRLTFAAAETERRIGLKILNHLTGPENLELRIQASGLDPATLPDAVLLRLSRPGVEPWIVPSGASAEGSTAVSFNVFASVAGPYQLHFSTNLLQWQQLGTVVVEEGVGLFDVPLNRQAAHGFFYRLHRP